MTTFELGACGIAWAIASIPLTQILDNSLLNVRKQRDGVAEVVTLCPTNGLF